MKEVQETAIVPTTQIPAELIPNQTADLIEKSFAENTIRNRRHALQKFREWLQGRQITDGLLAEYITHLFDLGKAPGTISIVVSAVKWLLKHRNNGKPVEMPITSATLSGIRREGRDKGRGQRNGCEILLLLFLNMTINHIIPRSRGSTDAPDNLQLFCGACNSTTGNRTQDELIQSLREQRFFASEFMK